MRNKVIFGTKTESKEAPWAVPIAVYRYEGVLHCTATLVSSRHIITARHCFVRDFEHGSFRYVFNGEVINKDNCRGEDYIVPPERSEADIHFATRCRDEETCENINLPTNLITRKPALVVLPGLCSGNVLTYLNQDDIAIVELDKDVLFSEKIHPICIDLQPINAYFEGDSGGGGIMERNGRTTLVAVLSRGEACGEHKRDKADLHMSVWYYSKVICKYTGICKM
ncbi:Protein CBG14949 [Caenorhabditis briggsae]|uniref:Protein CBG14949 n=1 Tax=Caenorhabditis briggsae TaxID=6238 RepID=A8XL28_CAEBR|nr:Protein CBG14949 [Caenorhabditis briggsae]CAP33352.2 Protein CBG14949 [Caenorhabditis briggsae]